MLVVNAIQQLTLSISALKTQCGSKKTVGCERLATEVDGISRRVLKLMTTFQSRILLHSANANLFLVGLACIVMWVVSF